MTSSLISCCWNTIAQIQSLFRKDHQPEALSMNMKKRSIFVHNPFCKMIFSPHPESKGINFLPWHENYVLWKRILCFFYSSSGPPYFLCFEMKFPNCLPTFILSIKLKLIELTSVTNASLYLDYISSTRMLRTLFG